MNTENQPVRLSRWSHVIRKDGNIALFHSLNLTLLFFENRLTDLISELKLGSTPAHLHKHGADTVEILEELKAQGFVVPVEHNDNILLEEKQKEYVGKPSLETIFMLLTDVCNFACRYCFIKENMPPGYQVTKAMSWDTARTAIDVYFNNLRPTKFRKTIVFYGGEPLLAFDLLRQAVDYIQEFHREKCEAFKVGLLIITNGSRITDEVAQYFASHPEISLNISLDGEGATNDQKRIYLTGQGTFSDITAGIERLHSAGRKDINISATIDEHNIDRLDEMLKLNERFHFQSINFNPLLDTIDRTVSPDYTRHATKRLLEYFKKARELGLYEDRIMRKVRAISRGVLHPFDCRATGAQIAVSPDGFVGICHEGVGYKNFFFGKLSPDFAFEDNAIVQEWGRRSPLMMPQCFSCPSLGLCGGGCAYCAYLRHGTIWAVDDKFCEHSLEVLNWIIWDVYENM